MDCDWAILCDRAYKRTDGRTNIEGVFDTIKVGPGFVHPGMDVVMRLVGDPGEAAAVNVDVCAPGGSLMGQGGAQATLGPIGTLVVIVRFPGFPINRLGLYSIVVSINGEVKKTISLVVDKLP